MRVEVDTETVQRAEDLRVAAEQTRHEHGQQREHDTEEQDEDGHRRSNVTERSRRGSGGDVGVEPCAA